MTDILCAALLGGCEGTGFWPGGLGMNFILFALSILAFAAVIWFAVHYWSIRKEMDE